jgi:hypothetical protein
MMQKEILQRPPRVRKQNIVHESNRGDGAFDIQNDVTTGSDPHG